MTVRRQRLKAILPWKWGQVGFADDSPYFVDGLGCQMGPPADADDMHDRVHPTSSLVALSKGIADDLLTSEVLLLTVI